MIIKICHISSVHSRSDTRIFLKQCLSLAQANFEIYFLVIDQLENDHVKGVEIINCNSKKSSLNRFKRMFLGPKLLEEKINELEPDIVHFHDIELIFLSQRIKKKGIHVVYDVHEDTPSQILEKEYLPKWIRKIFPKILDFTEKKISKKIDAIVTATPHIKTLFENINPRVIVLNNYPLHDELFSGRLNPIARTGFCFVGGITVIRGIKEVVASLRYSNEHLHLAGKFQSVSFKKSILEGKSNDKIKYHGFLQRSEVSKLLETSIAGVVTFLPSPNHVNAQPNKLFEYMSAGLPVIASNFPLWKTIVEGNNCGICVDPKDPSQIAEAMIYLRDNPQVAKAMGENGRKAVLEKYNWKNEEKKLIDLYNTLLS
jgi:glycosyltransferase involved in cell wall biosynthesis